MSGGRFNYMDSTLKNEIFSYSDKPFNRFEDWEISKLVWDVLELIHDFDWYESGDTGKSTWLKAKKEFKEKWFKTSQEDRVQEIIDIVLKDAKEQLYNTFGLEVEEDDDS